MDRNLHLRLYANPLDFARAAYQTWLAKEIARVFEIPPWMIDDRKVVEGSAIVLPLDGEVKLLPERVGHD